MGSKLMQRCAVNQEKLGFSYFLGLFNFVQI